MAQTDCPTEAEALVSVILTWMGLQKWSGQSKATDYAMLQSHQRIVAETRKTTYSASVRDLAERAGINKMTARTSDHRLQELEVLKLVEPSQALYIDHSTTATIR